MVYKKYKTRNINIYTIKTDKFKNCRIELISRSKLIKDEVTKRSFLSELLIESTKNYNSNKKLKIKLENLYDTGLYSSINKVGKYIFTSYIIDFLNPIYFENEKIDDILELFNEIINNPDINNNGFNEKNFEIVKKRIRNNILSTKDDPMRYSIFKLLESMKKNSIESINMDGNLNDLEKITKENLYKFYLKILKQDDWNLFVIGNLDMEDVVLKLKKIFNLKKALGEVKLVNKMPTRSKVLELKENSSLLQSKLVIGINLVKLNNKEKNITMFVLNNILGGNSLSSKLAVNLRQKNSLCYNVSSIYQKYSSIIIINSSISKKNYLKARNLIYESINELKEGNITLEELESAKKNIITSLQMSYDYPDILVNNYIFNVFDNVPLIEKRIKEFQDITKEDVVKLAQKLKINTIFMLSDGVES